MSTGRHNPFADCTIVRALARMTAAVAMLAATTSSAVAAEAAASATDGASGNVYVGDSSEATRLLKKAEQWAQSGKWIEATREFAQAVERFADKVVYVEPGLYVGIPEHVNRQIATWPSEGLKAYRSFHAESAGRVPTSAASGHDWAALLGAAETYFCTPEGARAADLAAQIALESADFSLAERLYRHLLAVHPDRAGHFGEWAGKLALTLVWAGRDDAARDVLAQIEKKQPTATIRWSGRTVPVSEAVQHAWADRIVPSAGARMSDWPLIGGDVRRNRVADGDVEVGAPLWECGADRGFVIPQVENREPLERNISSDVAAARTGRRLSMVPVTDGQSLYLCDASAMWGIRLSDGTPTWPPFLVGKAAHRAPVIPSMGDPPPLYAPTFHDGRLFAALTRETGSRASEAPQDIPLIVCLDAVTGKAIWSVEPAKLDPRLAEVRPDAQPVPYRDRLFVTVRRQKRFGFEDCYLLSLSADGGRLNWMTHLASASTGNFGRRRPTMDLPCVSEATVYVCTNLGAVVAVDAYSGHIRWLRLYQDAQTDEEAVVVRSFGRRAMPWRYTPSICWGDRIVCSPVDSDRVLILDRLTGAITGGIPAEDLGHFEQILGVKDDVLYAAGMDLVAWDLAKDQALWSRSLMDCGGIMGRGQLAKSHLYLPMGKGLFRFGLRGGEPQVFEWTDSSAGGNVLVTSDQIVVVGADRVTGYASKQEAFSRLRRRIEQAPNDPAPLLDLAEIASRIGELRLGADTLKRAVTVGGGHAHISDARMKARLFNDFIRFGDRAIAGDARDEPLAMELYQQAAECAPDADGQVLYRLRLADLFIRMRSPEKAIEQYQQILSDPSLRRRTTTPRDGRQTWPAGQWAERQIGVIIAQHGQAPYEAFERQAAALLAMGKDSGDPAPLEQVIERFPNSQAAQQALVVKAELVLEHGDYVAAARAFTEILNRQPHRADAADIMRRIIDCFVRSDRPHSARRWAVRAAQAFPEYRFQQGMRTTGFADWAATFTDRPTPIRRPRFSLPLTKSWTRRFPSWVTVLQPQEPSLRGTRSDLYVTYCANRIEAFSAPANQALWASPVACNAKPAFLGMTQGLLIMSTRHKLFGVEADTGKVAWFVESAPPDADRPELDPESVRRWAGWTMAEDHVVALLDDGQAICLDARRGKEIWRGRLANKAGNHIVANDEFVVYEAGAEESGSFSVVVLDVHTGRHVRVVKTEDAGRAFWMGLTDLGTVLASTGNRVCAVDPYAGRVLWQTPLVAANLRPTLTLGADSLYLSHNGRTLVRRSLKTGEVEAESPSLAGAGPGALVVVCDQARVFAGTSSSLYCLDAQTLGHLWRGQTDRHPNMQAYQVGVPFAVAIDQQGTPEGARDTRRYVAYFYDRREDSGLIPANGVVDLGGCKNPRGVYFADHSILIVDGSEIHGWTGPGE